MKTITILNSYITYYWRVSSHHPKQVTLAYFLGKLSEKYKDEVIKIRSHEYKWYKEGKVKKKEYQSAKEHRLPCVCPSAIFEDRRLIGCEKEKTGILIIDIDDQPNPEKVKHDIMQLPYVFLASLSVSGEGVYCGVWYNKYNDIYRTFRALEEEFLKIGYRIDPSCTDITRTRYVSYDPNMLIKTDVEMFDRMSEHIEKEQDVEYEYTPIDKDTLRLLVKTVWYLVDVLNYGSAKLEYYIPFDDSHNNYVTEYDYHTWMCDGFRLATIGNDKIGLALFDKISMNADNYQGKEDVRNNFDKFKHYSKVEGNYSYYFSLAKRLIGKDWKKVVEERYKD